MVANDQQILDVIERSGLLDMLARGGYGSGANWSLSRWGKSTGKWAEKDTDVALELAQDAKQPMPLAGLSISSPRTSTRTA